MNAHDTLNSIDKKKDVIVSSWSRTVVHSVAVSRKMNKTQSSESWRNRIGDLQRGGECNGCLWKEDSERERESSAVVPV